MSPFVEREGSWLRLIASFFPIVNPASQGFDPKKRRKKNLGPVIVNRCDDMGHPFLFRRSDRALLGNRHDKRFPVRFCPSRPPVLA